MGVPQNSSRIVILITCFAFIQLPFLLYIFIWTSLSKTLSVADSPMSYALAIPGLVALFLHQKNYVAKLGAIPRQTLHTNVLVSLAVAELGVLLAIFLFRSPLGVYVASVSSMLAMLKITYDVATTWPGP